MTEQPVAAVPPGSEALRNALRSLPSPLNRHNGELRGEFQRLRQTWADAQAVAAPAGLFTGDERADGAAVAAALRNADNYADALRGDPLWEQLKEAREATARMRRSTVAIVGEKAWRQYVVPNDHWKRLWADVGQNSSETYARLAGALADRLEGEGRKETAGAVRALRELSSTAAAHSLRMQELPRDGLPTQSPEAVGRELNALRHPFPGYGPHGGFVHDPQDRQLISKEIQQAAADVNHKLREWTGTEMGQRLLQATHPSLKAFRQAWKAVSDPREQGDFRKTAQLYGRVAARAHQVREEARKANVRNPGRYSARDIAALDAFADASYAHAARLARTRPPGNNPGAAPYESPHMAQAGNREVARRAAAWQQSEMGQALINARPRHQLVTALGTALKDQPPFPVQEKREKGELLPRGGPHTYDQWAASAKMGEVADAAKRLLDNVPQDRFSKADMDKLRSLADGARMHASKLAEAAPSRSVLPKNPALGRVPATSAQRPQQAPAPAVQAQAPARRPSVRA
ncbi:hypothetical protein ITI46_21720 [Streptomyces oryzae]|uniref:Uncharacterized protein n=1 Tax=Streptomyces oryzae TaxID=1434886 RepID=A0ABS3XGW3_9ACTN|nr:hypothetical protein [Streptomyces oryzae]MBO8194257.1 hypothetical protein [Streptomyces oryzae]